jgi:hypothetical protein
MIGLDTLAGVTPKTQEPSAEKVNSTIAVTKVDWNHQSLKSVLTLNI